MCCRVQLELQSPGLACMTLSVPSDHVVCLIRWIMRCAHISSSCPAYPAVEIMTVGVSIALLGKGKSSLSIFGSIVVLGVAEILDRGVLYKKCFQDASKPQQMVCASVLLPDQHVLQI